jgi:outer membrane protein assembly factor BamA
MRLVKATLILFLAMSFLPNYAFCEESRKENKNLVDNTADTIDRLIKKQAFTLWNDPWIFQGVPLVFPTPNTGFNLGVRTVFANIRRQDPHQFLFEAQLLSSDRGRYKHFARIDAPRAFDGSFRISAKIAYDRDISLRYFGVGNNLVVDSNRTSPDNTYYQDILEGPSFNLEILKYFGKYFRAGPVINLKWNAVSVYPGSLLETQNPLGTAGGRTHSLGLAFIYDELDFEPYPSRGYLHELYLSYSHPAWGSDYTFFRGTFTFRKYFALTKDLILANRLIAELLLGDVPFYEMGAMGGSQPAQDFGGSRFMRGYLGNEYIDKMKMAFGMELRWDPIEWELGGQVLNIGFCPFIDVGRVWPQVPWPITDLHASVGWGMRFIWNHRFTIRADYAINSTRSVFLVELGNAF